MSSLKFVDPHHWDAVEGHLTAGKGERFAFVHGRVLATTSDGPVVEVIDVELIADTDVRSDATGWYITDAALDRVHNAAVAGGYALVEFHNHHRGPAGFSRTDESGLEPMANYVTDLLPGRPYGAGVYADGHVHVEHWTPTNADLERGTFRSVVVLGNQLRVVNAVPTAASDRHARQANVIGAPGSNFLYLPSVSTIRVLRRWLPNLSLATYKTCSGAPCLSKLLLLATLHLTTLAIFQGRKVLMPFRGIRLRLPRSSNDPKNRQDL